jgi:hypothetical protein
MANWVENRVEITGERAKEVVKCLLAKGFGCAIERPKELEQVKMNTENKEMIEKYGYNDWYSWSIANWGTKWNIGPEDIIVEVLTDSLAVLEFDTAWSEPLQAMVAIAKKFKVNIEMVSIEEISYSAAKYLIGDDGAVVTIVEVEDFYDKIFFEGWKEILGTEGIIDYLYNAEEQIDLEESIVTKMLDEDKPLKEIHAKIVDIFNNS